jgi:predicted RNA binding protein YcfA (HicA-like mRNA interferase family)
MKFTELVRLLEQHGFRLVKEKGSVRYYAKAGHDKLIRVDYHGAKEVPTGTFGLSSRLQVSKENVDDEFDALIGNRAH